jgi:molybdopterin converting factor small subunit
MVQTVRIHYYAQLRDALKTSSEDVDLEFPALERDILDRLASLHPRQRDLLLASRVAVDDGYLDGRAAIKSASVLDIISPVSGG